MTAWGLAWRTIARSPARSMLAVAGVTVIGALLFNMLLLSRGLLVSFRDLIDAAGYDIRIIAAQGSLVHREPIADAPRIVQKHGVRAEVRAFALLSDRVPLNRGRAVAEKDRKDVVLAGAAAGKNRPRAQDAIVAA